VARARQAPHTND